MKNNANLAGDSHPTAHLHPHSTNFDSPLIYRCSLILIYSLWAHTTAFFAFPRLLNKSTLVDFDAFYIVGKLTNELQLYAAYHYTSMFEAQLQHSGTQSFMPWSYPPQFAFVVWILATLPQWLAYAVFIGTTLTAFIIIMHRIAGQHAGAALVSLFPACVIAIKCGQNGFLTASLLGWYCILFLRGSPWAGIPLGCMIIKPHLAIGAILIAILYKRWATVLLASTIVIASSLISTIIFGTEIWPHFLNGISESREFLKAGIYPLFRMVSIYSLFRSSDFSYLTSIILQITSGALAIAAIIYLIKIKTAAKYTLAASISLPFFLSPYVYDYDLVILSIAHALLISDLRLAPDRRTALLTLGSLWAASGYGLMMSWAGSATHGTGTTLEINSHPSVAAIGLLAATIFISRMLATRQSSANC